MGIRFKQIEDIKFVNLEDKNILVYSSSENVFKNSAVLSSEAKRNTVALRDNIGNIQVGSAKNDTDAVNISYLKNNGYITASNISSSFVSNTISYTSSGGKILSEVKLPSNGNILMSDGSKIAATSYIREDHSDSASCGILISGIKDISNYKYNGLKNVLLIDSTKSNYDSEISIITSSNSMTNGACINAYTYYNPSTTGKSYNNPLEGQQIFGLNVYAGGTIAGSISFNKSGESSSISMINGSDKTLELKSDNSAEFYGSVKLNNSGDTAVDGTIRYNATQAQFQGYKSGAWVALDSTSDDTYITNEITSMFSIGNLKKGDVIPSNTSLTDFARLIVGSKYEVMMENFEIVYDGAQSIPVDGVVEYGANLNVSKASFVPVSYGLNSISDIKVTGKGFTGTKTAYVNNYYNSDDASTAQFSATEDEYTWSIEGYYAGSTEFDTKETYSIKTVYASFFGSSSIELSESSASSIIDSLQYKYLTDSLEMKVTCDMNNQNASNYTYIAFPANEYGSINHIHLCGMNITDAFESPVTVEYTNSYGKTHNYVIYKSRVPGAFSSGNILYIK